MLFRSRVWVLYEMYADQSTKQSATTQRRQLGLNHHCPHLTFAANIKHYYDDGDNTMMMAFCPIYSDPEKWHDDDDEGVVAMMCEAVITLASWTGSLPDEVGPNCPVGPLATGSDVGWAFPE
jgi:hypothetical protein